MGRLLRLVLVVLLPLAIVLAPRVARAACTGASLLTDVTPPENAVLVDGAVAPEGSPWPDPDIARAPHASLTWDLGHVERIGAVFFQADADQPIDLETSADGETWSKLAIPAHPVASGMLGRIVGVGKNARLLRVSTPHPSKTFTVTEVIATCADPEGWNPAVHVVVDAASSSTPTTATSISRGVVDAIKLAIVLAALVLIALRRTRGRALMGLAAIACVAWFELGAFHRPGFVHEHDVFHYYVGSKYFAELGYDGLYDCAAAAEAEAGFVSRVELRAQRDLRTNALVPGASVLARSNECRSRFSPSRWRSFSEDVRSFASRRSVEEWNRVLKDHGFNASPTWIALSAVFSRTLAESPASVGPLIAPLDPLLLVIAFGALFWAFGPETACIALLAFACNPLADFAWVGGGFLRQLWFTSLAVGIALLARRRATGAGIALALASLLQIFPALSLGVLVVAAIGARRRTKRFDPFIRRVLVAAALTVAVVMPASAFVSGRTGAWSGFVDNTEKHAATPSANRVGLVAVLAFRSATRAELLFDERAVDPFEKVRAAQKANYASLRIVHWLVAGLAALLAVVIAVRRVRAEPEESRSWWMAATAGMALVPFLIAASSYYSSFVAIAILLSHARYRLAIPLLAAIAASLAARLAGAENDVYFALASVFLVGAMAVMLVLAARSERMAAASEEPAT